MLAVSYQRLKISSIPKTYLESTRIPKMKHFFENSYRRFRFFAKYVTAQYFRKKASLYMAEWVLNSPLCRNVLSNDFLSRMFSFILSLSKATLAVSLFNVFYKTNRSQIFQKLLHLLNVLCYFTIHNPTIHYPTIHGSCINQPNMLTESRAFRKLYFQKQKIQLLFHVNKFVSIRSHGIQLCFLH